MGFDGKTLVHPTQVEPANGVLAVGGRGRVLAAGDRSLRAGPGRGQGVITVDGRMIENLHVDNARRAIAMRGRHRRPCPDS